MLEESDCFTQIGPSHAHPGPVDADTNSEQCGSFRQVAQGWLPTLAEIISYLNSSQMDPEPTQLIVGFRAYQSLTQLATKVAYQKGDSSRHQGRRQPKQSISYTVIEVYPYGHPSMKGPTAFNTKLQ